MANSKTFLASVLLSLFVLHLVQAVEPNEMAGSPVAYVTLGKPLDCGGACEARCILSSRPRRCKRACRTCCLRCQCVPPGTSGNLQLCPCYAAMTTRGNRRKCP